MHAYYIIHFFPLESIPLGLIKTLKSMCIMSLLGMKNLTSCCWDLALKQGCQNFKLHILLIYSHLGIMTLFFIWQRSCSELVNNHVGVCKGYLILYRQQAQTQIRYENEQKKNHNPGSSGISHVFCGYDGHCSTELPPIRLTRFYHCRNIDHARLDDDIARGNL